MCGYSGTRGWPHPLGLVGVVALNVEAGVSTVLLLLLLLYTNLSRKPEHVRYGMIRHGTVRLYTTLSRQPGHARYSTALFLHILLSRRPNHARYGVYRMVRCSTVPLHNFVAATGASTVRYDTCIRSAFMAAEAFTVTVLFTRLCYGGRVMRGMIWHGYDFAVRDLVSAAWTCMVRYGTASILYAPLSRQPGHAWVQ